VLGDYARSGRADEVAEYQRRDDRIVEWPKEWKELGYEVDRRGDPCGSDHQQEL
jgi:hypothetical protein